MFQHSSDDNSSDSESQNENQSDHENQLSCSVGDWIIKIKRIEMKRFRFYNNENNSKKKKKISRK